jgi:predicted oxidoreductase
MKISGGQTPDQLTEEQVRRGIAAVAAAYEAGFNHFDLANIYGRGACEQIFGKALQQIGGMRESVIVTTKCGIRFAGDTGPQAPQRYDFSHEHIIESCEESLQRMQVQTIDLYLLHRPDFLMQPAEIAAAFDVLRASGKVRYFGVSNFTPSQVRALQAYLPFPLAVNQVRIHPGWLEAFSEGTLDQCIEMGITPEAYSPVGKGMFATGGTVPVDHAQRPVLEQTVAAIDEVAGELGAGRTAVTLAWLLKHPAGILPIVGSSDPDHIRQTTGGDSIELSREQWYRIMVAARGQRLP